MADNDRASERQRKLQEETGRKARLKQQQQEIRNNLNIARSQAAQKRRDQVSLERHQEWVRQQGNH